MDLTVISIEPRLDSYKKAHFSSKDNESGPSIGNCLFSFHFYSCPSFILCGFAHDMALFAQWNWNAHYSPATVASLVPSTYLFMYVCWNT